MSAARGTGQPPLKILTVDEHPLTREGLARVLTEIAPHDDVIEAGSLASARARLVAHSDIRLVVLDPVLPDTTGIEAVERVIEARPGVSVLVLSAQDDPTTVRAALDAGARGFISRRSPIRVLVEVLRLVLVGGTYIPPEALRAAPAPTPFPSAAPATPEAPAAAAHKAPGLTPRQLEVLALLVQGKPNKLICRTLNLAEGTIKTHIAAIYRALGVVNRTQAVYAVTRLGIELPAEGPPAPRTLARESSRPQLAPDGSAWERPLQFA